MKSRTCPGCGVVHPTTYTKTKCEVCKTLFHEQICSLCKEIKSNELYYRYKSGSNAGHFMLQCKPCSATKKIKFDKEFPEHRLAWGRADYHKRMAAAEVSLVKWLAETNVKYKPLTEAQWLEACAYFEGCTICGEDHIETRDFFVAFKDGGRYAAWNVFPLCGKCSTRSRLITNPFVWIVRHTSGFNKYRRDRLLEYLTIQIEKASEVNEHK